jgi:hypothetical protein
MAATVRDYCLLFCLKFKEYKMKQRNILKGGLFTLLMMALVANAAAEQRRGILTRTEVEGHRYFLHLDTTGNRITDTYLTFNHPQLDALSNNLETFLEKGMEIVFDDQGAITSTATGNKQINGNNTISIDGDNMIFLFPNERERFKFAAQEYDRQRAAANQSNAGEPKDRPIVSYSLTFQTVLAKARREL